VSEVRSLNLSIHRCRAEKLSMIESIECLNAELKYSCISHTHIFPERQIKVVDPGTIKDAAFSIAELPQSFFAE